MKVARDPFSEGLAAFRRLTAEEAPLATVTRARVLAGMQRRRRRGPRTLILGASAMLVIVCGALAAAPWVRQPSAPSLEGSASAEARAPGSPPGIPPSELPLQAPAVD